MVNKDENGKKGDSAFMMNLNMGGGPIGGPEQKESD